MAHVARVMVSGCFDLLHSGHVAFMEEAASHGQLHVAIGSDRTILELKGRPPVTSERERQYLIQSLRCVHKAFISSGSGFFDFLPELDRLRPDIFFVNSDGDTADKRQMIEARGIRYVVSKRIPRDGMATRSTTALRDVPTVPYRLDLAGGWLDQPFVSKHHAGPVINCSLEPREEYERRSGLASSTRAAAMRLWGPRLPVDDPEKIARMLFACENPPGTLDVAGSQDPIGIVFPGVHRLMYNGKYWPDTIDSSVDPAALDFLEAHVHMLFIGARPPECTVLGEQRIDRPRAGALADAAEACWDAINRKDAGAFGRAVTAGFDAQVAMFPGMSNAAIEKVIEEHRAGLLGYKLAGAGGGGYLVAITDKPTAQMARLHIRRDS